MKKAVVFSPRPLSLAIPTSQSISDIVKSISDNDRIVENNFRDLTTVIRLLEQQINDNANLFGSISVSSGASPVFGSGSANKITKWLNASNLTYSIASDNGTTFSVAGALSATGNFAINTNKFTVAASTGNTLVAGTLAVTSDFAVATSKFTVAAASGNTLVAGTFTSTGIASFNSVTDATSISTGSIVVAGGGGFTKAVWVGGLMNVAGVATFANTTDSSSTGTGGGIFSGGVGIAKKLTVGTNVTAGNSTAIHSITGYTTLTGYGVPGGGCAIGNNYWHPYPFASGDWSQQTNVTIGSTAISQTTADTEGNIRTSQTGFTDAGTTYFMRVAFSINSGSTAPALAFGLFSGPTTVTSSREGVDVTTSSGPFIRIFQGSVTLTGAYVLSTLTTYILEITMTRPSGSTNNITYALYTSSGVLLETNTNSASNTLTSPAYIGCYFSSASRSFAMSEIRLYGPSITGTACVGAAPTLTVVGDTDLDDVIGGTWKAGIIQVLYGGTGVNTLASNGVLYGNGTSPIQALAVNSSGTTSFLSQTSSGAPAWISSSGTGNVLRVASPTTTGIFTAAAINMSGDFAINTNKFNVTASSGNTLIAGTLGVTGAVSLTVALTVANGGIGVATLASNGVLYGNGTSAVQVLAVNSSATNKFLTQSSSGAPAWATIVAGDLPGSFSGFANPSASVGLSANNGSATTAMRSDATPALSVSITPTWTGVHNFGNTTDSTSVSTGSGVTAGGWGFAKAVWIGGLINVAGAATLQSTLAVTGILTQTGRANFNGAVDTSFSGLNVKDTPICVSGTSPSVYAFGLGGASDVAAGNAEYIRITHDHTNAILHSGRTGSGVACNLVIKTGNSSTIAVTVSATNQSVTFAAQPIFSTVTASTVAGFDSSKGLISYTTSGSGTELALTASPTFTGTLTAATLTATGNILFGPSGTAINNNEANLTITGGTSGDVQSAINMRGFRTTTANYAAINGYHGSTNTAKLAFYRDGANDAGGFKFSVVSGGSFITNTALQIDSAGVSTFGYDIKLGFVGKGIYIKEGSNATMGVATLVLGVATVSTTKVTANSRIFLTPESLGTITAPVAVAVTARTAGTSFTITSANLTDTSVVAWLLIEPA